MKLTRAQRDILWSDFRADDSGRATALGHWFAMADIVYHADPRARKLDPALVAHMEQPE